jgi:hypothetical protein
MCGSIIPLKSKLYYDEKCTSFIPERPLKPEITDDNGDG